jgi:glycosyltransferase involved in cell wall biosynthesis
MAAVRVLHVLGSLERGGVETWLLDLIRRLDRSRWQFDFCTLGPNRGRYAPQAWAAGSRVLSCPLSRTGFLVRLYRLLRAGGYSIVHSHVHCFSGIVLAAAKMAGVPVCAAHSHNTHDARADTPLRILYRAGARGLLGRVANLRLACSGDAAAALYGRRCGEDPRVRIVRYGLNGILENSNETPGLRRQLGLLNPGTQVVGHVGRFERQKNHRFVLQVALAVKARRPGVRWLLIGDGELRPAIEQQARRLGLDSEVVFAGRREDVCDLMSGAMDAFIFPSLHEGLPLALLEAQAAGLRSVVSTQVTPEAAVVRDAVDFLPLAASPDAWAAHVLAALDRGRLRRDQAAAELKAGGFAIDRSLESLLAAYASALAAAKGAARRERRW